VKKSFDAIKLSFILCGTVIGAGFASGKELISFFGAFGAWAAPLCALCGVLFVLGFRLFMGIGKRLNAKSADEFNSALFGRAAIIADIFVLLVFVVGGAAMLSAADSLFTVITGRETVVPWFSLITAAIVFVCVLTGLKGLMRINSVVMPVLVIFLCGVSITAIVAAIGGGGANGEETGRGIFRFFREIQQNSRGDGAGQLKSGVTILLGLWAAFTYAGMNFMQSFPVMGRLGIASDILTAKRGTIGGGALLGVLMTLMIFGALAGGIPALDSDLPLLYLAGAQGRALLWFAATAIWLALSISLLASSFSLTEWAVGFIKCRWLSAAIVLLLALTVSMLGFSVIVKYFFPVQGALGLVYVAFAVRFEVRARRKEVKGKKEKAKSADKLLISQNI